MPLDASLAMTRGEAIDGYVRFFETARDIASRAAYDEAIAAGASHEDAVAVALQASGEAAAYAEAELGRMDLFFLLVFILNRPDANRDWIFDRCRDVQADCDDTLDLWARYHYKSTIITFAQTIQEILRDPEITICIFSDVNKVARPFLGQIKRELESNERLKALYPDILWATPEREAPLWSEEKGIIVKRQGNPKEATLEAYGLIDGMPTGRHFKLRLYDDLVTINSVTSLEMMRKVSDRLRLSHALKSEGGRVRYAGTRYHALDPYAGLIDTGMVTVRKHAATDNGREDGRPVLMSEPDLAKERAGMGPFIFAAQMLMDPSADRAIGFDTEWLQYWPAASAANLNVYITVDPSSGKKGKGPAGNDYTAMWVVGVGADKRRYVLDHVRERLSLTQRAEMLFELVQQWKPLAVGYEEYGLQADIEYLQTEMQRRTYRFHLVPLGGRLAKVDRIRRLIPWFERGHILLPADLVRINRQRQAYKPIDLFVTEEYALFPLASHDDSLDALARILDPDLGVQEPISAATAVGSREPPRLPLHVLRAARASSRPAGWQGG